LASEATEPLNGPDGWFDLWHYHADFSGYGNLSASHRRRHLAAHADFFRRAAGDLHQRSEPFQLWLYLNRSDAGTDAVYVHTPNPNGTPFPLRPQVDDWEETGLAAILEGEFELPPVRVGRDTYSNFYAYAPGIGVSLE